MRSIQHIKLFLAICAFFATIISFLAVFDIVTISSFSGSEIVDYYSEYLDETSAHGLIGDTQVKRAGFLWMSNNAMAYQLGPFFVYFLFMVLKKKENITLMTVHIISMVIIFSAIWQTLSRGGILVILIGSTIIIFLLNRAKIKKLVFYGATGLLLIIVLQSQMKGNQYYQALSNRYESIFLTVKNKNLNYLEGNAFGRIAAAMEATNDIRQKPFFGWGNGKKFGQVGKATSNHVAYLEYIGKVGLIGFLVLLLLWRKTISDFYKSKRLLLYNGITDDKISCILITLLIMSLVSGFFQPQSFVSPLKLLISYVISVSYLLIRNSTFKRA